MGSLLQNGATSFECAEGSTTGATTTTLITFPALAVASSYGIDAQITGFEASGPNGYASNLVALVRSTGLATTLVTSTQFDLTADAGIVAATFQVTVSANDIIISVTGVVALTINWTCLVTIQIAQ